MVADTGATARPGGIRPLDAPQLVQVDVGEGDIPTAVRLKPVLSSDRRSQVSPIPSGDLSNGPALNGSKEAALSPSTEFSPGKSEGIKRGSSKGRWRKVLEVLDTWRIDDEWWRKQPVSRLYYRVILEDGTMTGLFKDLINDQWYQQRV